MTTPHTSGAADLPATQDQYLCQAWGETDLPAVVIVEGLDAVRAFLVEQWLGDAEQEHDDGTKALPAAMADMQEEWEQEGEAWKWSIDFEIGGISVQKVGRATHTTPPAMDGGDAEDAARYRVLRDANNQLHEGDICVSDDSFNAYFGEDLDKAVDQLRDRARAAQKEAAP